jgi:hypothetical protein
MTIYFPIGNILLSLGAAATYAMAHDWKHAMYWLFAAGIAISVIV